jgi:hypothetical protein
MTPAARATTIPRIFAQVPKRHTRAAASSGTAMVTPKKTASSPMVMPLISAAISTVAGASAASTSPSAATRV